MNKRNLSNKFALRVFIISLVLIFVFFVGINSNIDFFNNKETVSLNNKITKTSINTNYGTVSYSMLWNKSYGKFFDFSDDGTIGYYKPTFNSPYKEYDGGDDHYGIITYSIEKEANGSEDLQPGDLVFSIPVQVLGVSSSYSLGYYDFLDDNSYCYNESDYYNDIGCAYMFDIPYIDDVTDTDEFYWAFDDSYGSTFNVYNNKVIQGGSNYNASFNIYYSTDASFTVSDEYVFSSNLSISGTNLESNSISGFVKTYAEISSYSKTDVTLYSSWNNEWGVDPGLTDVTYALYKFSANISSTEGFTLNIVPDFVTDGKLVAYNDSNSSSRNYIIGDFDSYLNNSNSSYPVISGLTSNYSKLEASSSMGSIIFYRNYIVAYDNSLTGGKFVVDLNMTAPSGNSSKSISWLFGEYNDEPIEPVAPSTNFNDITVSNISSESVNAGVDKLLNNSSIDTSFILEPGVADINVTVDGNIKAFNNYSITDEGTLDYGVTLSTDGLYLGSSYSDNSNVSKLDSGDYTISSIVLRGDVEYSYQIIDNNYILVSDDVSSYSSKELYGMINGEWILLGTYIKDSEGNIVYTASDDKTTSNSSVSVDSPIVMPDNVTDVKIVYNGKKAAVYIGMYVNTKLLSSTNVKSLVSNYLNDNKVSLKLKGISYLNDSEVSSSFASTGLTKLSSSSVINHSSSSVKNSDGSNDVTIDAYVYEMLNVSSSDYDSYKDYMNVQDGGTFYVLLPLGVTFDNNISVLAYGSNSAVTYNVSNKIDNYEGTGRTMLVIDVDLNNNVYLGDSTPKSGFVLSLVVSYSRSSNSIYGTNLNTDIVYMSNSLLTDGYKVSTDASDSNFTSTDIKSVLSNIGDGNNNLLFAKSVTVVEEVTVKSGSYESYVKTLNGDSYGNEVSVTESGKYKYRLQYKYGDSLEEISDVVFYDVLESVSDGNRGYFDSIDISYLKNTVGINPVVYYSTNENIDLSIDSNKLLSNSSIWSTEIPSDKSLITAIAVDCGSYTMKASDGYSVMFDINMLAPNSYLDGSTNVINNNSVINYSNISGNRVTYTSNSTIVNLVKNPLVLDVVSKVDINGSNIGNGSSSSSVGINNNFGYLVSLSNPSENSYSNVVIAENIADIISIDESNLVYYRDINNLNSLNDGIVDYLIDGNNINFIINEISSNETINIWIPILIDIDSITSGNLNIKSSFGITSISGNRYNGNVLSTNHLLEVPSIDVTKYVKTIDSSSYTNTVAPVIISKGETYSYMIELENISNVTANGINVVDVVPSGLSIVTDSISNGGVYDEVSRTITWNVDGLTGSIGLSYSVTVSNDISLGTVYVSSGHVKLVNPLSSDNYLYDADTNTIKTIYQVASDIVIESYVSGVLADKTKEFSYAISLNTDSSNDGSYIIIKNNEDIGSIVVKNGTGSTVVKMKNSDKVTIKLLPGNVNYSISQIKEDGYVTSLVDNTLVDGDDEVSISGITDEEGKVSFKFINDYDVRTSINISGKVTYDKVLTSEMFDVSLIKNANTEEVVGNDENGNFKFNNILFNNVEGSFNYKVSLVNNGIEQIDYDTRVYNVNVIVENDGKGNLNATVKYYLNDVEVTDIIFENVYLPNGLVISSINNSDYIDTNKVFKYKLTLFDSNAVSSSIEDDLVDDESSNEDVSNTNGLLNNYEVMYLNNVHSSYSIMNDKNEVIGAIEILDTGYGYYEFTLKSNEKIIVYDLPKGISYTIEQELLDYYDTVISNKSYSVDLENNKVFSSGVIGTDTVQVLFDNHYETKASYQPFTSISLEEKNIEDNEFNFIIKDVSDGLTNGYTNVSSNDINGKVLFKNINYNKPGVYKYEISQVSTGSNHIYYDLSKCVLTVVLSDNGNGTMSVVSNYVYDNVVPTFTNKYSKDPIVVEVIPGGDTEEEIKNPNTNSFRIMLIALFSIVSAMLIMIGKKIRFKKFE